MREKRQPCANHDWLKEFKQKTEVENGNLKQSYFDKAFKHLGNCQLQWQLGELSLGT